MKAPSDLAMDSYLRGGESGEGTADGDRGQDTGASSAGGGA